MTVAPATFSSGTTASQGRKTWKKTVNSIPKCDVSSPWNWSQSCSPRTHRQPCRRDTCWAGRWQFPRWWNLAACRWRSSWIWSCRNFASILCLFRQTKQDRSTMVCFLTPPLLTAPARHSILARVKLRLFNYLFIVQAIFLASPGEGAIKFWKVVIGWFADDVPVELAQTFLVLPQGVGLVQALLHFQVRFPVFKAYSFPFKGLSSFQISSFFYKGSYVSWSF